MNIENVEAFVYVIHCGSFNKAAEALYLSQPSVTARIQSLERDLDCRLFDRQGKTVQITEEGKRFLPYAQQLLMTYRKGKLHVNRKKSLPEEIKIGCTVTVSNYVVPELIPRLTLLFPNTHFKFVTGVTDEIVGKVLNKEIDIGFVRGVSHPNLHSVKFYVDPISLYVYKEHPFVGLERISAAEVAEQPIVFFECGALDWLRVHRIFENLDRSPNIRIQTDNSEMAKKLVLGRAGICFLPGLSVRQEVAAGSLVPIRVPGTDGIALQTNVISSPGEHGQFLSEIIAIGKQLNVH
ncbi:LysR family transcriptional regulator [Cohnella cellulosilytica]|uniref:LysR family transcriptional regulator n=1 Tax=Cohnella cellulosilytica TaxID=986710 RepID=A0ABW2F6G2_9BACL